MPAKHATPQQYSDTQLQVRALSTDLIPVTKVKKDDLIELCRNGTIPTKYHGFYKNLPSSEVDKLSEPDYQERSDDED